MTAENISLRDKVYDLEKRFEVFTTRIESKLDAVLETMQELGSWKKTMELQQAANEREADLIARRKKMFKTQWWKVFAAACVIMPALYGVGVKLYHLPSPDQLNSQTR